MRCRTGDGARLCLRACLLFSILVSCALAARTAHFTRASFAPCEIDVVLGVADYNKDGLMDLVGYPATFGNGYSSDTLTHFTDENRVLVCTALGPGGNFSHGQLLFQRAGTHDSLRVMAFTDFNGDGSADLWVRYRYWGTGAASLSSEYPMPFPYSPPSTSSSSSYYPSSSPLPPPPPPPEDRTYTSSPSTAVSTPYDDFNYDCFAVYALLSWDTTQHKWMVIARHVQSSTQGLEPLADMIPVDPFNNDRSSDLAFEMLHWEVADYRKDGHLGVLCTYIDTGVAYLAVAYPTLQFHYELTNFEMPFGINFADRVHSIDVNGDGWLDIAYLHADNTLNLLVSIAGSFREANITCIDLHDWSADPLHEIDFPYGFETMIVGDFNGDGRMDLGFGVGNDPTNETLNYALFGDLVYYQNTGAPPFFHIYHPIIVLRCPLRPFAVGDVNHDGLPDVLGMMGLWLASNASVPGSFFCQGLELEHPYIQLIADFNGDGRLDALGHHSFENRGPCPAGTSAEMPHVEPLVFEDFLRYFYSVPHLEWHVSYTTYPSCAPCVQGVTFQPDSLVCGTCLPGSFPPRPDLCRPCGSGQFSAEGRACESCEADHVALSGASKCEHCAVGSIPDSTGSYCVPCPSGTYYSNVTLPSRCLPCADIQISAEGATQCVDCTGNRVPTVDRRACVFCPAGQGAVGAQCFPCGAGEASSAQVAGLCGRCDPGSGPDALHASCQECPPGTYESGGTCRDCGANATSPGNATSCDTCTPGNGPSADRTLCVRCPAGSYSDSGVCLSCPLGFMSASAGATACTPCDGCGLAAAIILPAETTADKRSRFKNPPPQLGDAAGVDRLQNILLYIALATFLICGVSGLAITCWVSKQPRAPTKGCIPRLTTIDLFFATSHRVSMVPGPVAKRRTVAGALLTIAVVCVFVCLIAGLGLRYARDNLEMAQSQLPLQVLASVPAPDLSAVVTLYGYGGPCNNIHASGDGMGPVTSAVGRDSSSLACAVAITCTQCSFTTATPALTIDYAEPSAYAQSLGWNVSAATASVAGANWVAGTLSGGGAHVIQGVDPPSQLRISAYYQQTSGGGGGGSDGAKDDMARDEYVLGMVGATLGATANETTFAPLSSPGIRVTITLQREAFYVQRLLTARQSFAAFATGVFGAISGILVVAKFLLAVAEELRVTCLPNDAERAAQASGQGGGKEGSESVLRGSGGAEMFPLPESNRS